MATPVNQRPIIHAGSPQRLVIQTKSKPADQVQGGAGGGTQAGDVARIRRYLRFQQSDVQHGLVLAQYPEYRAKPQAMLEGEGCEVLSAAFRIMTDVSIVAKSPWAVW